MHAPRSNDSIARAAADTLVAFESLTYSTPSTVGDLLEAVRHAGELAQRGPHRLGVERRARGRAAAAIAFSRLWRPRRRTSAASISGSSRHSDALRRSRISQSGPGPNRTASASRSAERARPFSDRDVVGCAGWRTCAAWPRGRRSKRPVAVEVVRRQVQEHGRLGRERRRVLELEARRLAHDRRRPASSAPTSELTGVPTLPATATGGSGGPVHRAEQLDRGRLAVRAGHRDELVRHAAARPARARRGPACRPSGRARPRAPPAGRPGS